MTDRDRHREPDLPSPRRHLSGSILSVGASRGASLVALALTSVVITRLLGPAGIGAYSIAAALLFVFTVLFELGLPQALAYYAGREEWGGRPLARGAIGACFLLAVPGAATMVGGFALFGDLAPGIDWPMAIALALALPFSLLWRVGPQAALARERFETFALLDSSLSLLACPISIAAAALAGTQGAVIGFAASVALSGTTIAVWLVARSARAGHDASPPGWPRAVLAYGARAWSSELLTQVNLRADLVLLGAYAGAAAAGVYSVALSTTSIAWVLTAAFAISALPRSARLHAEHGRDLLDAADRDAGDARTIRHTVLIIPAVAAAELLLLGVGIPLFYGEDFHRSIGLGLILLPGSLLLGVGMAAVAVLLGRGQTRLVLKVGLAVVPATIAALAIAIPAGGATGAAIVSTVSYTAYAALALLALGRASGMRGRELLLPRGEDVEDYRTLVARGHIAALRLASKLGAIGPASHLLGALLPKRDVEIELGGSRLTVPISDPYWSRLLAGMDYEPGVGVTIEKAIDAEPDAVFLDCGANIGYWATAVCGRAPTVAVEAVPTTYSRLEANAQRNGFVALNAALWDAPDETRKLTWSPRLHYAASLTNPRGKHSADIRTVTVDRLVEEYAGDRPVVVKLDVEGAEAEALAGASRCGDRCLFIYEDHGGDREHRATSAFLDAGFRIWHVDASPRPIASLAELDEIKRNRIDGYNFAAYRGPTWSGLLPETAGASFA